MLGPRCARFPANGRGYEFLLGHWDWDQSTVGFGSCERWTEYGGGVFPASDAWAALRAVSGQRPGLRIFTGPLGLGSINRGLRMDVA